jgi:hypothetical protein
MRRKLLSFSSALVAVLMLAIVTAPTGQAATAWALSVVAGSRAQSNASAAPGAPGPPAAVCNSILFVGFSIKLTWAAVTGAASYTVYQATAVNGTYANVGTVSATVNPPTWTSPALGSASYWFKITYTVGQNWEGAKSTPSSPRTITLVLCT